MTPGDLDSVGFKDRPENNLALLTGHEAEANEPCVRVSFRQHRIKCLCAVLPK